MSSTSTSTVAAYLADLPPDRRAELAAVRRVIRKHLPRGYKESVDWNTITYAVPLRLYPDTCNGKPLCYAGLGSRKNHLTLYLMNAYGDPVLARRLKEGFRVAGRKLDMGKACIRFRQADDLALEVVGEIVASTPLDKYVAFARAVRRRSKPGPSRSSRGRT